MNADQIGIALKGRRNGSGWLVRCPCPNHGKGRGDRFPSLSVTDGDDDRLLLRCFAGCEFVDILDELKRRGLADGTQSEPLRRFTPSLHRFVEPNPDVGALTIWQATVEAQETVVDEYLNRRGIYLRPPMLRCRLDRRSMVAAVQAPDGKIIAIQQTWLTGEGEKASAKRLTTGNLGAGAVRLGAVARIMGLAEGVETALSAMQLTGMTVWASLGASRLHSVELPPEVEEVQRRTTRAPSPTRGTESQDRQAAGYHPEGSASWDLDLHRCSVLSADNRQSRLTNGNHRARTCGEPKPVRLGETLPRQHAGRLQTVPRHQQR
jgi:putative DNA primase/helicase